jgi:hypothetical protein
MFAGKRNVFTVLFILLGSYLIILPTTHILIVRFGNFRAAVIGFVIFFIGYYYSDRLHKK